MTASNNLDDAFRLEMARMHPRNARSCTLDGASAAPVATELEWLAARGLDPNDAAAVGAAFVGQVGPSWSGVGDLAPVRRAALVLLAADLEGVDVGRSLAELSQASLANEDDAALLGVVLDGGLDDPAERRLGRLSDAHAFGSTILWETVRLLKARPVPFQSSEYMWLKERDREAWLSMVCCGRGMPFVEVAGIWLHHRCEKRIGRPLPDVWTKPLVEGIADAVGRIAA